MAPVERLCFARSMTPKVPLRVSLAVLLALQLTTMTSSAADSPPPFIPNTCGPLPWIIGFDTGSTTLTPFARKRLDALVAAWYAEPGLVLASGRVDGQEDHPDEILSARRLAVVVAALEDLGLSSTAIWPRDDAGRADLKRHSKPLYGSRS